MFESIYSVFYNALDAIFLPMVQTMQPAIFIFVTAFLVSFIINLATKLLVNQDRMAELKDELQEFQVKAKKASKDPELIYEKSDVITSYSIHYTKLYEYDDSPLSRGRKLRR